jgi:hypothetical protein
MEKVTMEVIIMEVIIMETVIMEPVIMEVITMEVITMEATKTFYCLNNLLIFFCARRICHGPERLQKEWDTKK